MPHACQAITVGPSGAVTVAIVACDGGEDPSSGAEPTAEGGSRAERPAGQRAREPRPAGDPSQRRPPKPSPKVSDPSPPRTRARPPKRGRTVRLPSGARVILPPPPTRRATSPSPGCVRDRVYANDGRTKVLVSQPPTPGGRAQRTNSGTVRVSYRFRSLPARCMPIKLEVMLDVWDDALPGQPYDIAVRGLRGSRELPIPEDLPAVDVVMAQSVTSKGLVSRRVRILIT